MFLLPPASMHPIRPQCAINIYQSCTFIMYSHNIHPRGREENEGFVLLNETWITIWNKYIFNIDPTDRGYNGIKNRCGKYMALMIHFSKSSKIALKQHNNYENQLNNRFWTTFFKKDVYYFQASCAISPFLDKLELKKEHPFPKSKCCI